MPIGYSPKLPLFVSSDDGPYALTKTHQEAVQQNFKNLILTSPGERIMDPRFGVGLRDFLFEQKTIVVESEIRERIGRQVSIYMPFVVVLKILFLGSEKIPIDAYGMINNDENLLSLSIVYRIAPLQQEFLLPINVR